MKNRRMILIVDDDHEFLESCKDLIENEGYEVCIADNGTEGLDAARMLKPNLMILDVMMTTNSEGFEVSRKIPSIPELKDLPVIILTGIREALNLPYGFEPEDTWLPVKVVLEKPVAPKRLLEEIKKHVS